MLYEPGNIVPFTNVSTCLPWISKINRATLFGMFESGISYLIVVNGLNGLGYGGYNATLLGNDE